MEVTKEKKKVGPKHKYSDGEREALLKTGAKLKDFRNSKGWTMATMAQNLGRSVSQVAQLEKGNIGLSGILAKEYYDLGFNINCIADDDQTIMRQQSEKKDLLIDTKIIAERLYMIIENQTLQAGIMGIMRDKIKSMEVELQQLKKLQHA